MRYSLNIFVKEVKTGPRLGQYKEVPNWPVIILFSIGVVAVIIALSVFFYHRWRKTHCAPVMIAGKTLFVCHGDTFEHANRVKDYYGEDWLSRTLKDLKDEGGYRINGVFTDVNLTEPFDQKQPISAPVHLYPKITK